MITVGPKVDISTLCASYVSNNANFPRDSTLIFLIFRVSLLLSLLVLLRQPKHHRCRSFFFIAAQPTSPTADEFNKLSPTTQKLATQICQMGFQRDLVIRAFVRIGEDDKKVVEHLIPLSELLQMGFEEEQVSEALVKFNNDKDRALDYLIS